MKNYYEILEVSENASKDVIEKVYKVLAKKYHPDLQQTQHDKIIAEEKMKEINEAYSILSDDEKRAKYNQKLEAERRILENKKNSSVNNTANNYTGSYSNNYSNNKSNNSNYSNNYSSNYSNNSNMYNNVNKNTNVNQNNSNVQNDIEINSLNEKMNKNLKKKQKKLEKELKRKMEDAYLKAYGEYLRKNGYNVKYRFDYRGIPILIGVALVLILIGWLFWIIPITHNYLVNIYNENIIIKKLVDIIINLFKR